MLLKKKLRKTVATVQFVISIKDIGIRIKINIGTLIFLKTSYIPYGKNKLFHFEHSVASRNVSNLKSEKKREKEGECKQ